MMRLAHSGSLKLVMMAIMLLWASTIATPAKAALVTYEFSGSVSEISTNLLGDGSALGPAGTEIRNFSRPTSFSGSYRFDPATTGTGTTSQAQYPGAISEFTFTIHYVAESLSYSNTNGPGTVTPLNNITVVNDATNTTFFDDPRVNVDTYTVVMTTSGDPVYPAILGTPGIPAGPTPSSVELGYLYFNKPDGTNFFGVQGPFTSTSLTDPGLPPQILTLGSEGQFRVFFSDNGLVTGVLTNFSLVATPLPPAVILFGAGLVSLIGLGARNWRQRKDCLVAGSKN